MTLPAQTNGTRTAKFLSASCQQVTHEDFTVPTAARVIVRTCIADPVIFPSISQHLCNGVALTPSGLYADMAAVVATYIWRGNRSPSAEAPGLKVFDMDVDKPYIIQNPQQPRKEQWLEMEATIHVPECSSGDVTDGTITCLFRSIRADGTKIQDQAHCSVQYEFLPSWHYTWTHSSSLLQTKIANLHTRARTEASGVVQHMYRDKAYREFKTFVDYGPKYQNMAEVVVDTTTLEGTATHAFQPDRNTDYTGPFYLDGSCHLSGFICNAIEQNRDKFAYISHGLDAMKISPRFAPAKGADIKTYVHMAPLPGDDSVLSGDVYVLQEGEIVGVWEGVKFKRIPRRVLNVFLPPPRK